MRTALALVVVGLLAGASLAHAEDDTAAAHQASAEQAMHDQRFAAAADEYAAAYAISGDVALLYPMGIAHQHAGDCAGALIHLRRFLAESAPDDHARVAAEQGIAVCEAATAPPRRSAPIVAVRAPGSVTPEVVAPPTTRVRKRYPLAMIATDLALVLTVGPASEKMDAAPLIWGLAWVIVPAIIHATHENDRQAGWSVVRRLLLPTGGAIVGALIGAASDCNSEECWDVLIGGVLGLGIGAAVAMIADWATAYIDVDVPATTVIPSVEVTEDRAVIGLATRF